MMFLTIYAEANSKLCHCDSKVLVLIKENQGDEAIDWIEYKNNFMQIF